MTIPGLSLFYGGLAARLSRLRGLVYTDHGRQTPLSARASRALRLVSGRVDRAVVVAAGERVARGAAAAGAGFRRRVRFPRRG